jgi:hypothetical protein
MHNNPYILHLQSYNSQCSRSLRLSLRVWNASTFTYCRYSTKPAPAGLPCALGLETVTVISLFPNVNAFVYYGLRMEGAELTVDST